MFIPSLYTKMTAFFVASFLLIGCGSGSSDSANEPERQDIEIEFSARVGNEVIRCQEMTTSTVGTANTIPTFKDIRMFISQVALLNEQGEIVDVVLTQDGKWQYQNVALLDFETGSETCANGNPDTNSIIKGTVPEGDYAGIQFTLGVPMELNHYGIDGDDSVSPLDVTGMNWSWQNGHKHIRMDIAGWNIHLGTTGCETVQGKDEEVDCSSSRPNRPTYQFDKFNPASNVVVLDYQRLVASSDVSVNTDSTPLGCMSSSVDADCQNIFRNLGLDLASGQCLAGNCATSQSWVSVE